MMQQRMVDQVTTKLSNYIISRYGRELRICIEDCPHLFENPETDVLVAAIWATFVVKNPYTKQRVVDEFADKHVTDPVIANNLRRVDDIIVDEFKILDGDYDTGIFNIKSVTNDTKYRTTAGPNAACRIFPGRIYHLLIHPWEADGTYNITTVLEVNSR